MVNFGMVEKHSRRITDCNLCVTNKFLFRGAPVRILKLVMTAGGSVYPRALISDLSNIWLG